MTILSTMVNILDMTKRVSLWVSLGVSLEVIVLRVELMIEPIRDGFYNKLFYWEINMIDKLNEGALLRAYNMTKRVAKGILTVALMLALAILGFAFTLAWGSLGLYIDLALGGSLGLSLGSLGLSLWG